MESTRICQWLKLNLVVIVLVFLKVEAVCIYSYVLVEGIF
jgi:hypothetical protein